MKTFLLPLLLATFWIFLLISKENELMELRLLLPKKEKELQSLREEKLRRETSLHVALTPQKLLNLLRTPRFSHLEFPLEGAE